MSKTAEELYEDAINSKNAYRRVEALKILDQVTALDPNFAKAYYQKGLIIADDNQHEKAIPEFEKAISVGMADDAECYFNYGISLKKIGRYEEAVEVFNKCHSLNPAHAYAYFAKGNTFMLLDKRQEAIECYIKTLRYDPNNNGAEVTLGQMYQEIGNNEAALKHYDNVLGRNHKEYRALVFKAHLMFETGKITESKDLYETVFANHKPSARTYYRAAKTYEALGLKDKATECYKKATEIYRSAPDCDEICHRGQCWMALGDKTKAFEDFKTAQELLITDKATNHSPGELKFVQATLKSIFEAEELNTKAEAVIKDVGSTENPLVKNFIKHLRKLQNDNEGIQGKLIDQLGKKESVETNQNIQALDHLKAEFEKKLAEMTKEMNKINSKVSNIETVVKEMGNNLEDIKEELKAKLTDFETKLDIELDKQDLSSEDKKKLKGYFHAFLQTFSSVHVTAQVIDSGQVQIDADSSAATILSMVASFAPFVGSVLSSGIKSLGDFLKSQEIQKNARKLKGMASDATRLSQLIGKAGFEILQDKEKQRKIINTTDKDLREASRNLYEMITKFCDNINEKIDAYLYTELYSTPAERVGHNDANELIEKFLSGKIPPYEIQTLFVEEILKTNNEETQSPSSAQMQAQPTSRSACCNMF